MPIPTTDILTVPAVVQLWCLATWKEERRTNNSFKLQEERKLEHSDEEHYTLLHENDSTYTSQTMSAKSTAGPAGKKPASAATNLIAGGGAGMMEALACHPLDTIKVRMQLSRRARAPGAKRRGFITTGAEIVKRESPLALYKGLGAVMTDRKSTRLNSSHSGESRMPSSA